jgi:pyruvate/2-oxoglutarate dehydrogenase complex dihydrolipoamide acyltransferase (E2) component
MLSRVNPSFPASSGRAGRATYLQTERWEMQMRHDVHLPALYEGMTERDAVTIIHWYARERDIVQAAGLLLRVDAGPSLTDIPQPFPAACQITHIYKKAGEIAHVGDLLVTLETLENQEAERA